jgi:hypothetical protein
VGVFVVGLLRFSGVGAPFRLGVFAAGGLAL